MSRTKDLLIGVGVSTKTLNRDLGNLRRGFNRSFGEIKAAGRKMSMAISAPLLALGATATKVFVGFEHSMAKVKAVSGATGAEFQKLESSAKQLGKTTIFTAQQVADLQLVLAKMGVSADGITKVQTSILQLAQATDSDLAQAADVVSSTLRAFGKDMSEGQHLADVMAASFSNSALSMDSFSNAMQYVAPVAKAANVSIEETTAMLAVLANNGVRGSKAGRAMRRILGEMEKTGKPATEAIRDLAEKGLDLSDAFDEVGRSAQTQLLILAENVDKIPELAQGYKTADGAAAGMAATMDDTTFGAFKRMSSAIEGAQIAIGTALAPMLERLSEIVANAMAMFSGLSPAMQRTSVIIGIIAAAIGPLMVLLPSLVSGFGMVAGVLSGPVLLAIGGVIAAVVLLRRHWDTIKEYFTNGPGGAVFESLKEGISVAIEAIIQFWQSFVGFLIFVWESWGNDILSFAARMWEKVGQLFRRAGSFLANAFGTLSELLQGNWGRMWQRLQNMLIDAVILIIDGASYLIEELLGIVDWGLSALGVDSGLADGFGGFVDATREYLDGLKYEFETTTETADAMFAALSLGFSRLFAGGGATPAAPTMDDGKVDESQLQKTAPQLWERGLVGMDNLPEVPPPDTGQWSSWANGFRDMLGNITTFTDALTQSAEQMGTAFGNGFAAMISGADDAKEQMKNSLKTIVDTTFAAATAHMIEAAVGAGKYSGPAAPIVIPTLIAAGMALVRGAFGAVAGFAEGGIVSGPTMGLVAEYPGARTNPEVIAPLDKLQSMIGGNTTNVVGTIRGRDIVLSNQRGGYSRRRAFG